MPLHLLLTTLLSSFITTALIIYIVAAAASAGRRDSSKQKGEGLPGKEREKGDSGEQEGEERDLEMGRRGREDQGWVEGDGLMRGG